MSFSIHHCTKPLWRGLADIDRFNTLLFFLIWFPHYLPAICLPRRSNKLAVVLEVRSVLLETTSEQLLGAFLITTLQLYRSLDMKIKIMQDLKHSRTIWNCDKFATHADRWQLYPTTYTKRFLNDANHCMIHQTQSTFHFVYFRSFNKWIPLDFEYILHSIVLRELTSWLLP